MIISIIFPYVVLLSYHYHIIFTYTFVLPTQTHLLIFMFPKNLLFSSLFQAPTRLFLGVLPTVLYALR